MRRFLAVVVLVASMGSVASAQPKLPTAGLAQGFICYSGNFCGYPPSEQKFDFYGVTFDGILAIGGNRYVGEFRSTRTVGHYTSATTATLDPVSLFGTNALGQTVAGNCTGRYGLTATATRVVFDCLAGVSGGPVAPVRLVLLLTAPGWLGDSGDGPACVCSDLIGVYFRQA